MLSTNVRIYMYVVLKKSKPHDRFWFQCVYVGTCAVTFIPIMLPNKVSFVLLLVCYSFSLYMGTYIVNPDVSGSAVLAFMSSADCAKWNNKSCAICPGKL